MKRNIQDLKISVFDIICEVQLDTKEYKKYIEENLYSIIEMIKNAIKQKTLDKLFII